MSREHQMVDVNLNAPNTPEGRPTNVHLGAIEKGLPYIDYAGEDTRTTNLISAAPNDGKPHLRFFAVGPSTYQIRCPLCKQRADTETVQMSGILGQLSCLLSTLSCCFPIFSLSLVYCCLQSRLKSKRMFCNKCGGYLGFYWRPT